MQPGIAAGNVAGVDDLRAGFVEHVGCNIALAILDRFEELVARRKLGLRGDAKRGSAHRQRQCRDPQGVLHARGQRLPQAEGGSHPLRGGVGGHRQPHAAAEPRSGDSMGKLHAAGQGGPQRRGHCRRDTQ